MLAKVVFLLHIYELLLKTGIFNWEEYFGEQTTLFFIK